MMWFAAHAVFPWLIYRAMIDFKPGEAIVIKLRTHIKRGGKVRFETPALETTGIIRRRHG